MRAKEAKRKENEKKQQEPEKAPDRNKVPNMSTTKELPAYLFSQNGYFVKFLNKQPNKEEAEKIMEIWNKNKPETQRSILKYPQFKKLINKASEICGDAEEEEPEQKPTSVNLESEEEEELDTTPKTRKNKRISTEGEEDEGQEATKSKKSTKEKVDTKLCEMFEKKYHRQ